jgi:S1-C subfamily serine protease
MKKTMPLLTWTFISLILFISVACSLNGAIPELGSIQTVAPEVNVNVPTPQIVTSPALAAGSSQLEDTLVTIYEQVSSGVVLIQTIDPNGGVLGSGFVYDTQGHIITNMHVVEGATEIEIDFPSGQKVHGTVIGTDSDSDIAVISVDVPADQLHPLNLGDSAVLKVGQFVVAIGNPYGLSSTMTVGIISAMGRTLESIRQTAEGTPFTAGDIIQTDASINPGNSGGPLLNLQGEVIGINRAIRTSGTTSTGDPVNTGIGFAVSINIVKRVVPELITNGTYDYPYLGLSCIEELSLVEQEALGLSQSTGAYVMEVVSGGPSEQAGLVAGTRTTSITGLNAGGDLIIAVDDQPVRVYGDLVSYIMTSKSPGNIVILKILRNGEEKEVSITLGRRP